MRFFSHVLPVAALLLPAVAMAAEPPDAALLARAEKIVQPIVSGDAAKAARVRDAVALHYADLQAVQAERDQAIAAAKQDTAADKLAAETRIKQARDAAQLRLIDLHYAFLGRLAAELTPEQVDRVKDGMTYGVLPLTWRVYQEMLPNLTPAQKTQIYAWLVEAREHAIDGFSSGEKHAWFGKYKGRITNYLTAAGYDLKQAEHDMVARQKAAPVPNR